LIFGVLDVVEFGCVVALIILSALYLTNFQAGECYLDGYNGYTDLTVCYSVFWATVVAAIISFAAAVGQISTCCSLVVVALIDFTSAGLLSFWWFAVAVYWNYSGTEADRLGLPFQQQRTAAMVLPWVISASYAVSGFIVLGKLTSLFCGGNEDFRKSHI